jgi:hypothetical protein
MINKEDEKRIFLTLRHDTEGAINPTSIIRSPMERIDITLEDSTVMDKTTKKGIKVHLLELNPKVYRASGLTPF